GLRGREEGVPFVAGELKDRAVGGLAVGDQDALLAVLLDRGEEDAVTPGAEPGPRQTREIGHAHMSQPSFEVLVSSAENRAFAAAHGEPSSAVATARSPSTSCSERWSHNMP